MKRIGTERARNSRPVFLVPVLLCWLAIGCGFANPPTPNGSSRVAVSDGWLAMGTFFEADLRVRPEEEADARAWLEWARGEIARLEKIYSWHDPGSEISALNRALGDDEVLMGGLQIGSELESVLFTAIEIWEATGGAFDITVGPLVDVWADAAVEGKWPTIERLRAAKRQVGSERLLLLGDGELVVTSPGIRIDLDGLSKGAVLDRLRTRFEEQLPGTPALLSFGESTVIAIGDPDGGGWRLVARSRDVSDQNLGTVRIQDRALSVSSSLGSAWEIADETVSHIIDPRTGSAIDKLVEAIVISDRAVLADGWSTALLVAGANRAATRMAERSNLEASISESSGREMSTEGWEDFLSAGE
jgi:thiamine biosynthesis lipoprotein